MEKFCTAWISFNPLQVLLWNYAKIQAGTWQWFFFEWRFAKKLSEIPLIFRWDLGSLYSQKASRNIDTSCHISHLRVNDEIWHPNRVISVTTKGYCRQVHHALTWYPDSLRPVSEQCHWKYLSRPQLRIHSWPRANMMAVTRFWCAGGKGIKQWGRMRWVFVFVNKKETSRALSSILLISWTDLDPTQADPSVTLVPSFSLLQDKRSCCNCTVQG